MVIYVFVLLILTSLSAACTSSTAEELAPEGENQADQPLVIYSGRSESLIEPILDQFEEASGIPIEVRYGSTSELAGVLLEEGEKSPADLFFAQDPGGLGAIHSAGLLSKLPQEITSQVPGRLAADDGSWVGISGRARTIVYNTDAISDSDSELPDDLFGFVDPVWKGRIGWAPTNASFQAMVTAMRNTWGEEKTREWLLGIQANDPVTYLKNTPIVAAVGAGEVDVGFVNHYYLHRFLAEEGESFPARLPGPLLICSQVGFDVPHGMWLTGKHHLAY